MILRNQAANADKVAKSFPVNSFQDFIPKNQPLKGEKNSASVIPPYARKHIRGDIYGAIQKAAQEVPLGNKEIVPENSHNNRFNDLDLLRKSVISILKNSGDGWLKKKALHISACETTIWENTCIEKDEAGRIHILGLSHCGSSMCPICSNINLAEYRKKITASMEAWRARKCHVACLTATIRKWLSDDPEVWAQHLELLQNVWARFTKDKKDDSVVGKFKKKYGVDKFCRAFEDTSNGKGFHWHIHCGLYLTKNVSEMIDTFTPSQKFQYQQIVSEEFFKLWEYLVRKEIVSGKAKGKYKFIDLRKFVNKDLIQAPYPIVQFSFRNEEGNMKKMVVNMPKNKDGDYDYYNWELEDWKDLADMHQVNYDEFGWQNIRVIIKGGVSYEFPLNSERWANYLAKELVGGAYKLTKHHQNGEMSCNWVELARIAYEIELDNIDKRELGEPLIFNWAKKCFIFRFKILKNKRLIEFSRESDRKSSFNVICPDYEQDVLDELAEVNSKNILPDYVSKPRMFDMAKDGELEVDGQEYLLNEKMVSFELGNDIEDGVVFHGSNSEYYRKSLGRCGVVTKESYAEYKEKQKEKMRLALALSLYKRGHKENQLVLDRLKRIEEIQFRKESIHDFLKIVRKKISKYETQFYLESDGQEDHTWKYATDEEIEELKAEGKISKSVNCMRINKFKGDVQYTHINDNVWTHEMYKEVVVI